MLKTTRVLRTLTVALIVPLAFVAGSVVGPVASSADPVGDQPLDYRVEHVEQRATCTDGSQVRVRYDVFVYSWDEGGQAWVSSFDESQYGGWHHEAALRPEVAEWMGCTHLRARIGHLVAVVDRKQARIERLLDRLRG